jgi:hypothetical protein
MKQHVVASRPAPQSSTLLYADGTALEVYQGVENGQDVAAVLDHAVESIAKAGFALGFAMPFRQDVRRNVNIAAQFVGGMAAQEEAIEKGRFALRKLEIPQGLSDDHGLVQHG